MWVLIIYVLVALGVAIGIKLKEDEFRDMVVDSDEDDFVSKQLVFSVFWPLILFMLMLCVPYILLISLNKFIDKHKKK